MIKLPFFHQKSEYTCGPASLRMVFDFFGLKTKEDELKKLLKPNKIIGTKHKALIKIAQKKGFYCYVHEKANLSQLKNFLDRGFPVIVNYVEPDSNEKHYSVVIGYNKSKIIMNDPWIGEKFKINLKDFEKRWHGRKNKRWLMTISKQKFDIGKQYYPK